MTVVLVILSALSKGMAVSYTCHTYSSWRSYLGTAVTIGGPSLGGQTVLADGSGFRFRLAVLAGGSGWRFWLTVLAGGSGWRFLLAVLDDGSGGRFWLAVPVGGLGGRSWMMVLDDGPGGRFGSWMAACIIKIIVYFERKAGINNYIHNNKTRKLEHNRHQDLGRTAEKCV